jgi:hypothetical protein
VLAQTAWREDQKDLEERNAMVARALQKAFTDAGCFGSPAIRRVESWASRIESDWLADLSEEGFETVVFTKVEEVGPTAD